MYAAAFSLASFNSHIQQDQQACEILSFSSSLDTCADDKKKPVYLFVLFRWLKNLGSWKNKPNSGGNLCEIGHVYIV